MIEDFYLCANNAKFIIPRKFNLLDKISKNVLISFVEKGYYLVQSHIRNENLQIFLEYWIKNKKISFNLENIYELYLLSQEFELDIKIQEDSEFDFILKLMILTNNSLENKHRMANEEYIAAHIDYYLQNYSKQLSNVPFTSLYNIFNHKNINLNDHNLAYQFITGFQSNNLDDNKINNQNNFFRNPNLYLLIKSLDSNQLTYEANIDSISNREKYFNFAPKNQYNFFDRLIEENRDLKNQIEQFQQQQRKINNANLKHIKNKQNKQINKLKNNNKKVKIVSSKDIKTKERSYVLKCYSILILLVCISIPLLLILISNISDYFNGNKKNQFLGQLIPALIESKFPELNGQAMGVNLKQYKLKFYKFYEDLFE